MLKNLISGKYHLFNKELKTDSIAENYSDENYFIEKVGEIYYKENIISLKKFSKILYNYGNNSISNLKGMFMLLVYNKKSKKLYIFHDKSTSQLTMYYTKQGEYIYFSTSLKKLLLMSKIERKLDISSATEIYYNNVILDRKTLIRNVYKIELFHYLFVGYNCVQQRLIKYSNRRVITEKEGKQKWNHVFCNSVLKGIAQKNTSIAIPLSSGYDSNFILFLLSKNCKNKIKAFTVGGAKTNNEIPAVKEIVSNYKNVKLLTAMVDEQIFNKFPEIVWRLEGSVLECGIILQYVLAKRVYAEKISRIICGECADEVMNELYYKSSAQKYERDKNNRIDLNFKETPFYITNLLVLKKSSIMLNSFGIEGVYPYQNDDFIEVAEAIAKINKKAKCFHKKNCKKLISSTIVDHINTIGGATEFIDFISEKNFGQIKKYIIENNLQNYFKHKLNLSFESFNVETVDRVVKYFYILVFYELFISKKYDSYFQDEILPDDLLKKLLY